MELHTYKWKRQYFVTKIHIMHVMYNLCDVCNWRVDNVHPELLSALYDFTVYDDFQIVLKYIQ